MEQKRPRNANGTFQPGQPTPVKAGRVKGQLNKITKDIRQGAIEGFARHGSNGRGEGGFAGFCFYLAKKHPKAAAKIVEKLLPLTVNGTGFTPTVANISVVSVPSGHFLSSEDIERLTAPGLIEHHQEPIEPEQPLEEPAPDLQDP